MGLSIYPVLEKELPGFDVAGMDGKTLAHALPKENDGSLFAPLLGYISMGANELAELLGIDPEAEDFPEVEDQWFLAEDGLAAIRPMIDALRTQSEPHLAFIPAGSQSVSRILRDLEALQRALELAKANGVRFHLQFDY
jgi:hypothetical protein